MKHVRPAFRSLTLLLLLIGVLAPAAAPFAAAVAQEPAQAGAEHRPGGEVNIRLPDLNQGDFLGFTGHEILLSGLLVCVLGLLFGLWSYTRVKNLPVHRSMAEISDLIYETCKAYMIQQGKLLLVLLGFIGTVIVVYFLLTGLELSKIAIILLFSLIGMAGSYGVAWFGIRINTLANSRTAFASLRGQGVAGVRHPAARGDERGHDADLGRAAVHARHPALHPGRCGGRLLPRLRHRRVAGRRGAPDRGRHLHQDRRHRVRPDEGRLQDQGGRRPEPGRDRRLHRRQRRRLGGPDRGRLRDLRRHRRRADLVHRARRGGHDDPGAAAGLDLPDARHDGARVRLLLPDQQRHVRGRSTATSPGSTSRPRSPSWCGSPRSSRWC